MAISKWMLAAGAAGFLAVGCAVPAHSQGTPQRPIVGGGPILRNPLLGRLAFVLSQLNLTEAQKGQVKGFLSDAQAKAKTVRDNTSLTPVQRRTEMQAIVKALRESIMGILTPEQKARARRLMAAGGMVGPGRMLARIRALLGQLGLAPAQRSQIRGFIMDAEAKVKIVRESNMGPADKRVKLQAIEKALRESILGVLTPAQRDKLKDLLAKTPPPPAPR
ncbi:MAG TPA: Spy/CpxP family protein refolding chaperone [Armatimonadota bacterium]|jgi:hypothetical protein